jgi:Zn-dependent alcohol dehydrogenase
MVAVGIGRGVSVGGIGVDVAVGIAAMVWAARVHAIDMAVDCRSATLNVGVSTVFEPQALMIRLTTRIIKSGCFMYPLSVIECIVKTNIF